MKKISFVFMKQVFSCEGKQEMKSSDHFNRLLTNSMLKHKQRVNLFLKYGYNFFKNYDLKNYG
jgi:hypothetical protein